MPMFYATLEDETRCYFSVAIEADNRSAAFQELEEQYEESRIITVQTKEELQDAERRQYHRWQREYEGDYSDSPEDY